MKIASVAVVLFLGWAVSLQAQSDSSANIVITSSVSNYEYKVVGNHVVLIERNWISYRCQKYPETIRVGRFYDDFSLITKASVKGIRGLKPQYQTYLEDHVFINDLKVCFFVVPFSKIGETADFYFEKQYNNIRYFTNVYFGETEPCLFREVSIRIPSECDIELVEKNFDENLRKSVVEDPPGSRVYTYRLSDQPAFEAEPDMPGHAHLFPHLIVVPRKTRIGRQTTSYFDTYDHVYQWCKQMLDLSFADTAMLAQKAREITRDCHTEQDCIETLYHWVQQNIRYIAFEQGLAGYIPDNPHEVFRKKYGDCKGMANLLKHLLCSLGFDARFCWVNTSEIDPDHSLPIPQFNHAIVALFWQGKTCFLDPTLRFLPPGEYSQELQGQMALIEAGDQYLRSTLPELPVSAHTDSLYCEYRFDGTKLQGVAEASYTGLPKVYFLTSLYAMQAVRREDALKEFLGEHRLQDRIVRFTMPSEDSLGSRNLRIRYEEERLSGIQCVGDELYVAMDVRQDWSDATIDTAQRKYDYLFPYRGKIVREEILIVPEGYEVSYIPDNLLIETDNYSFRIEYVKETGRIRYLKEIRIEDLRLRKTDFERYNRDLSRLRDSYYEYVVLVKNSSGV